MPFLHKISLIIRMSRNSSRCVHSAWLSWSRCSSIACACKNSSTRLGFISITIHFILNNNRFKTMRTRDPHYVDFSLILHANKNIQQMSLKIIIKRLLAMTRECGIAIWYRIPYRTAAYPYRTVPYRPTYFFSSTVPSQYGTVRYGTVLIPHTAGLWY